MGVALVMNTGFFFLFFSQLWCHRVATFNLEFSSSHCKDFHSVTIGAANLPTASGLLCDAGEIICCT